MECPDCRRDCLEPVLAGGREWTADDDFTRRRGPAWGEQKYDFDIRGEFRCTACCAHILMIRVSTQ